MVFIPPIPPSKTSLQGGYDKNPNVLYDGSHPITMRASGIAYGGFGGAFFAADTNGASPFAIGFSGVKSASGMGGTLPMITNAYRVTGDTTVSFPTPTSVEFGAAIDLSALGGLATSMTITIKNSDVPGDESIYSVTSFSNGAGTNSVANLGIDYRTFLAPNITSTTGTAYGAMQVDSFGGSGNHYLAGIFSLTNSNPGTGSAFAAVNYGGSIGGGIVVTNTAGTMSNPFYFENSSAATINRGLSLINASGGIRTGEMLYVTDLEATSTHDLAFFQNSVGEVFSVDINGGVVVNEIGGASADVRIEGDTDAQLFFTQASTDRIGIGTTSPGAKVDIFSTATTVSHLLLSSNIDYTNTTGSSLVAIENTGVGSTGTILYVAQAAAATGKVLDADGNVVINESGNDKDFRVEGDTDANLLFTDASTDRVGVGTNVPGTKFHIANAGVTEVTIQDTAAGGETCVISVDATDIAIGSLSDAPVTFFTNNVTRLSIGDNASSGKVTMDSGRFEEKKGADVVAANDLTLGLDGNFFVITGNTQINAITTANWQAGSKVTLLFTGTPTVKHNTAGGAGTAVLFLAGSADLVAANNTILGLIYDGTQWQETFRKVA